MNEERFCHDGEGMHTYIDGNIHYKQREAKMVAFFMLLFRK